MFIILIIGLILIITFIVIFILIKKRKNHIGEIHTTYDGITNGNKKVRKKRRVVIVDQVEDDIAICKLHEYKDIRLENAYPNVVLNPKNHPSLTEDTLVEKKVIYGIRKKPGGKRKTLKIEDLNKKPNGKRFEPTNDSLSEDELKTLDEEIKKEREQSKQKTFIHSLWKSKKLKDK